MNLMLKLTKDFLRQLKFFPQRFFPGCLASNLFLFAANEFHGSPSRGDGPGDRQPLQVLRGVQERQGNLPPLRSRQGLYSQPDLLDLSFLCQRHALQFFVDNTSIYPRFNQN